MSKRRTPPQRTRKNGLLLYLSDYELALLDTYKDIRGMSRSEVLRRALMALVAPEESNGDA